MPKDMRECGKREGQEEAYKCLVLVQRDALWKMDKAVDLALGYFTTKASLPVLGGHLWPK